MAAVKPKAIPPSTGASPTSVRRADPEVTLTRHFELATNPLERRVKQPDTPVDPEIDWNDYSTLARGALPDGDPNDEPATLARPLADIHDPETESERDRLDDARRSTPIVQVDVATLTKAARELETLPREKKLLTDYDRTENTGATRLFDPSRRDTNHPPPLPPTLPPPMHPPRRSSPEPASPVVHQGGGLVGKHATEEESTTGVTPVVHTGSLPWVTSLPSIDPTPPPEAAIRTPLVMVTAPEDNLTRVAPLAPVAPLTPHGLAPHPPLSPPYPHVAASNVPLPRIAMAGSSLLLVAILALVAVHPRVKAAAAGPPTPTPVEVAPIVATSPPPVLSAVEPAAPPAAAPAIPAQPVVAATVAKTPASAKTAPASASTAAPRHATRAEPRRHGSATKPVRATSRPTIPVRREP